MEKEAFTFVELIVIIVIIGILAAIAIPKITSSYRLANETATYTSLQTIASALENYSTVNGVYPSQESDLTSATPPYLTQSYCGHSYNGYSYSCSFQADSYTVTASPDSCGSTGTKTYTLTTGGVISDTGC